MTSKIIDFISMKDLTALKNNIIQSAKKTEELLLNNNLILDKSQKLTNNKPH